MGNKKTEAGGLCGHCGRSCAASVSIFTSLTKEDQDSLMQISQHLDIKRGQTLFSAGSLADRIIVLRYGRIKLSRLTAEGQEIVLGFLEKGDVMGEDTLYAGTLYSSDLVALEDSGVCLIRADAVTGLVLKRPQLGAGLLHSLGQKLHDAQMLNEILSRRQATSRLAGFLLRGLDKPDGQVQRLSQEDIGSSVGLRRETVSRALNQLADRGYISLEGYRRITVRDPASLRKLYQEDAVL